MIEKDELSALRAELRAARSARQERSGSAAEREPVDLRKGLAALEDWLEPAGRQAADLIRYLERAAGDRPRLTLLSTFALGLAVGALIGRR